MKWLVCLCALILASPAMAQKTGCPANLCPASWKRWPAADQAIIDQVGRTCGSASQCAGAGLLPSLTRVCETQQPSSPGALCEWVATASYLAKDFLGGASLRGKPLAVWLRDDAPLKPGSAAALRSDAEALNAALGPSAWWHQASVQLGSGGRMQVKVEQRTLVTTLEPQEGEKRAETNQRWRQGTGLRLGDSFDLSGITYEAEQAVRLRFGAERLSGSRL